MDTENRHVEIDEFIEKVVITPTKGRNPVELVVHGKPAVLSVRKKIPIQMYGCNGSGGRI